MSRHKKHSSAIITDNGQQLEVPITEEFHIIEFLLKRKLIYACPDCGESHYHTTGITLGQIEERISQ